MPEPTRPSEDRRAPGPLLRLFMLIVSAGLAWAITLAFVAWLLGVLLTSG